MTLQSGDAAPDIILPDQDGRERALADFWRERPTLLVFLRHFG